MVGRPCLVLIFLQIISPSQISRLSYSRLGNLTTSHQQDFLFSGFLVSNIDPTTGKGIQREDSEILWKTSTSTLLFESPQKI